MKNLFTYVFVAILISGLYSCSVVKRNGYKQSVRYKGSAINHLMKHRKKKTSAAFGSFGYKERIITLKRIETDSAAQSTYESIFKIRLDHASSPLTMYPKILRSEDLITAIDSSHQTQSDTAKTLHPFTKRGLVYAAAGTGSVALALVHVFPTLFVLSAIAFFVLAMIYFNKSRKAIKQKPSQHKGKKLNRLFLVLGWISVALTLLIVAFVATY